uniref:Uncharacterized protein n=1 Tax=Romanomermis culicivorax TaxID=13658 RepID=A0A915L806_ROMCU
MSISPWHGTILSVDNSGLACLTALEFYGADINVNKRYPDLVALATSIVEKDIKNGLESKKLIDYRRTVNDCRLEYNFCKEDRSRMTNEKKFIENQINPVYPVAALFAADWNPNKHFSKLFCVAGENGLLFVYEMNV